jgi:hypothetical protein
MPILRIEHGVPNFDGWKHAFDSDPLDRKASGVTGYHVLRSVDDPNYVMVDLELGSLPEAEDMLVKLGQLWAGQGKTVTNDPKGRIFETVERVSL